ncbi:MAG: FtsX-like permease family protein [Desulfitobacterium sp.]|nr:FtsX-like permease family protein [Desulfitobacterium sp.]
MVVLWKKLLREILSNKGVYFSCILVIVIGLLSYTSMSIVLENLERAQGKFYEDTQFADGFIRLTGYPENQVNSLENLTGVEKVEGRIVKDARLPEDEEGRNRSLRLVSMPFPEQPQLNRVELIKGNIPRGNSPELLLDPKFMAANQLAVGDSLTLILEGRVVHFTIVGEAQSPEFIYAMRSAQDLYPDPETFGIAYVPTSFYKNLVKEGNLVNDLVFSLEPGGNFEDVKLLLEKELAPYGLQSIFPQKDQTSHAILQGELTNLATMANSLPMVFLGVSSIILYTMLRRLMEQQRGSIGTMKAFGFTNGEIIRHYLNYPLFIGGVGGVLGGLSGVGSAYPLTTLYGEFFALPGLESTFSIKYFLFGMVFSLGFSLLSGLKVSLDILRLDPTEAMRAPAPLSTRKTPFEKIPHLWQRFSSLTQMGLRNAFRVPTRSIFTIVGMAVVFSLMTVSWSLNNMMDKLTVYQFREIQTYDVKIAFNSPTFSESLRYTLAHEPGVSHVEPLLEVPATLRNQWLEKDVALIGIYPNSTLYHVLNQKGEKIPLPSDGIILSERLAKLLNVKKGDLILVESPFARNYEEGQEKSLVVQEVVPQYIGINGFMEIGTLQKLLEQEGIATSAILQVYEGDIGALKKKYQDADLVGSVESVKESLAMVEEMIETYGFTIYFLAVLAGVAGFALIYTSNIISLSERQRELASLRVLGLTPKEIMVVISSEQWLLTSCGIILGIPLSFALMEGMAVSMSSDLFAIPKEIPLGAFAGAVGGTLFSVWVAQTRAYRKVKTLPFVEILATKE